MRSMIEELYPLPAAAAAAAPVPSTFLCPLTGAVMRDPVIDIENNRHICRRNVAYIHEDTHRHWPVARAVIEAVGSIFTIVIFMSPENPSVSDSFPQASARLVP